MLGISTPLKKRPVVLCKIPSLTLDKSVLILGAKFSYFEKMEELNQEISKSVLRPSFLCLE